MTPFMKIKDVARETGLAQSFIRAGCRDGSIPHVMSGSTYYVNVPALLRKLEAESEAVDGCD